MRKKIILAPLIVSIATFSSVIPLSTSSSSYLKQNKNINTSIISNGNNDNAIRNTFTLEIDGKNKKFNSNNEAFKFIKENGKIKTKRYLGSKTLKNDDRVVNLDETIINEYDPKKIKPAYKTIYENYTDDQKFSITSYLNEAEIIKRYLDISGNEFRYYNEAVQSISDSYNKNIIENLLYQYQSPDKKTHYFNPFSKFDQRRFFNLLRTDNKNIINGYKIQDDNENYNLLVDYENKFFNEIFLDIFRKYVSILKRKIEETNIYKIVLFPSINEEYYGDPKLVPKWDFKFLINGKKNGWNEKHNEGNLNYNRLEKYVSKKWIKKYLSEQQYAENHKIFKSMISYLYPLKKEIDDDFYNIVFTRKFKKNSFLDFENLNFNAFMPELKYKRFADTSIEWYNFKKFGEFFKSLKIEDIFGFNISIDIDKEKLWNEVFNIDKLEFQSIFNETLNQTTFKEIEFKNELKKLSNFFYNAHLNYFKNSVDDHVVVSSQVDFGYSKINYFSKKGSDNYVNNSKENIFDNLFANDWLNKDDFSLYSQNYLQKFKNEIIHLNKNPIWNNGDNISNYKIVKNNDNLLMVLLDQYKNNYFDIIQSNLRKEDISYNENFNNLNSFDEKIEYILNHWVKLSKAKKILLSDDISSKVGETQLLDTLKNHAFLNIEDDINLSLIMKKTFIAKDEDKFIFNSPYNEELTFNNKEFKNFKEQLEKTGVTPRVKFKIEKLQNYLKSNGLNVNDYLLSFNDPEIILQNYRLLLNSLILPSRQKAYYVDGDKKNLLDLNFFDLWEIEINKRKYHFATLEDLNNFVYKYINNFKKEIRN
ncbi:hypothetical protein DA803_02690 [[Mycoplasma] phocae]|uniref:Uncharacterized protein n=1 Tax=[Mycoplasma] phocae TaxID=142651 RepID=A0A2Z5IQV3_9BACT|nr:hypothetical protein [[Mycoplasma] phocae]AXE60977.1 hypothetical protein DA803_02690 [[Mycoplasma] phocae]